MCINCPLFVTNTNYKGSIFVFLHKYESKKDGRRKIEGSIFYVVLNFNNLCIWPLLNYLGRYVS